MKEEKILNEITTFCEECPNREKCLEKECVLFRIEQIALEREEKQND